MPQKRLFNEPGPTPDVKLPDQGVSNLGDDFLRAVAVALGIEEQKPGDGAGALGGMAGLLGGLGLGKLRSMNKGDKILRRTVPSWAPEARIQTELEAFKKRPVPGSMAEFQPMPQEGTLADLPQEEIDKAIELTRRKPPKK